MYNFKVLKPCKNCPFRKDSLKGWLGRERALEISNAVLIENKTFQCHETIGLKHKSHCAGALILYKYGKIAPHTNSLIQIAERLGMYEPSKLDESIECFHTQEDFVNHHSEN